MTQLPSTQEPAARIDRNFRTFLLMAQLAAREIGERIALARKESGGMTQDQLADLMNVSKRSLQDYEAGKTIPYKHFEKLLAIFPERSLEWFLHGKASGPDEDVRGILHAELGPVLESLRRIEEKLSPDS